MNSQSPYQAPESPQWQNQPQVDTSPGSDQHPPSQPFAGFLQQPGYIVQQPYLPMQPQPVMYQLVPQYVGYPAGAAVPQQSKGLAIASLVLGIIGVVTSWIIVGLPVSIVGFSLAIPAIRGKDGKGMAIAGLVLSIIGVVIAGVLITIAVL